MFSFSQHKAVIAVVLVAAVVSMAATFFIFRDIGAPAAIPAAPTGDRLSFPRQIGLPNARIFPPQAPSAGPIGAVKNESPTLQTQSKEDAFVSFLNKIRSAAQQIQPLNTSTFNAANNNAIDFVAQKSTVTTEGVILNLEPDEFAFIYPRYFLDSLQNIAQPFIQGENTSFVPLSAIKTDADVRMIEEKLIDAVYQAGIYTSEQAAIARETIRFTLPRLQLLDLQVRAQGVSLQEHFKNKNFFQKLSFFAVHTPRVINFVYADKTQPKTELAAAHNFFFGDLLDRLKSAILPVSQAICGSCSDSVECYQGGAAGPEIGSETYRIACRCTGCLSGLGCLDGCGSGVAAIFDPKTRICGCGL